MFVAEAFFAGGISALLVALLYWIIGLFGDFKYCNNEASISMIFGLILLAVSAIIYLIIRQVSKSKKRRQ